VKWLSTEITSARYLPMQSVPVSIPQADLKRALSETQPVWKRNLERLLESGQFVLGDQLAEFERGFARATGASFALGVGSGTNAIELCLRDAGITSPDQQVLTSPLTAPFTGLAVLNAGATLRFADVCPDNLLLNPDSVATHVTAQTAAIMPVHLYGQACPLARFAEFGKVLVQDACQAHGATCQGRALTGYSRYVAYSFYPTKNLGCLGDGGAVATDDPGVAERIRSLRDGGRCGDHISHTAGMNSRLDELQCCFLLAFLPCLTQWNAWRAERAALYDDLLTNCPGIQLLKRSPDSVNHLYVVRAQRRDALREYLGRGGITTGIHYPVPLHLQPAFASSGGRPGEFPHAERACQEILSLPLWPYMDLDTVELTAKAVRSFYR